MFRRILLVLSVALLMAAMLVASAMPAFADARPNGNNCVGYLTSLTAPEVTPAEGANFSSLDQFENAGDYQQVRKEKC